MPRIGWLPNRPALAREKPAIERLATVQARRQPQPEIIVDRECTQIERLVVQGAQRQAVRFLVGTTRLMPLDVGRLEPDLHVAEPQIMAAHCAAILVRAQHAQPERGIAATPHGLRQLDPDRRSDVLVQPVGTEIETPQRR